MSNNPRQTVGAAVRINENPSILKIDGSTVLNPQGMIYANGPGSQSGSVLIDAISAISSTDIKTTTITFKYTSGSPTVHTDNFTQYISGSGEFTITIDWVGLEVIWSGIESYGGGSNRQRGSMKAIWSGKSTIQTTGSSIDLLSVLPSGRPAGTLVTGANKKILGLPIAQSSSPDGVGVFYAYTITTDTGVVVTAAPTPPAETPTVAPVVGVKISELNAATSLTDTDLFVLSRDDPAGAPYDKSLNVTLSTLKGAGGWSSGWSAAAGNNTSTSYSHTLNSTDVVWQIYVAENAEGLNAIAMDVQFDLLGATSDTYGAMLSNVTGTSFKLILGVGYFDTLYDHVGKSFVGKFVKVVGRRS